MTSPRLTFWVMHLLGVGHLHRARRLIEQLVARGISVDIIYGGAPTDIEFATDSIVRLPPISARDASYSEYVDSSGNPVTAAYMESRRSMLLDRFANFTPDIILFETFPFGRRIVRNEIIALLEELRVRENPPLVVSSIRDILEHRKPERHEEAHLTIQQYFDYVLVHSDCRVIELSATFPFASEIQPKTLYTGFVVPPRSAPASPPSSPSYDIIVSVGGGGFGTDLLTTAVEVSCREEWSDMRWCVSTGIRADDDFRRTLMSSTPSHVTITDHLDDLHEYMSHARLSVSQCGYNTAMDVMTATTLTDCRAVFVPYDTTNQTEQARRADLLSAAGFGVSLPNSALTPESLSDAMTRALDLSPPSHTDIDMNGTARTADLVLGWLESRR